MAKENSELKTPAAKFLKALNDGQPFAPVLDDYSYKEALAILDSLTAEIREKNLGGKGYMDSAEDKGVRIDFESNRSGIHYPYRKAGLDEKGCRIIIYSNNSLTGIKLEEFIENKVRFFEGLNISAESEFLRQNLYTFNELQLAELLEKHDPTFSRTTIELQMKLKDQYEKRRGISKRKNKSKK